MLNIVKISSCKLKIAVCEKTRKMAYKKGKQGNHDVAKTLHADKYTIAKL